MASAMNQFEAGAGSRKEGGLGGMFASFGAQVTGALQSRVEQAQDMLYGEPEEEPYQGHTQALYDEVNEALQMPYWQRVIACVAGMSIGAAMIFISVLFLPMIILRPTKFAMSFTLGNLVCLASICFLVGPSAQLEAMLHPVRATAGMLYITSLLSTLIFAFFAKHARYFLVLVSVIVELGALAWYALSYVPYGRQLIASLIPTLTGTDW
ncbi:Vesicle transport protein SFT2A [Porphyridium purpureum]|uniref:Vesicle transport protein n=1 Tax=Porphyridium purpureum TaxID=35688 RepID=A0A5J4Z945_PORPP|nr:Vesicle transport protein SFT2A [Porphyridium purpureum]|eukprot:POR9007..scf295_1